MAISDLGRLTSHPGLKTGLRTRFRDSQPTINWASEPPNKTIFSCAITLIIAQRTDVRKRLFCSPHRGWLCGPGGGFPADSPREEPSRTRDPTSGRRHSMGIHSIGIHSNGMDTIPMECIHNGMDW